MIDLLNQITQIFDDALANLEAKRNAAFNPDRSIFNVFEKLSSGIYAPDVDPSYTRASIVRMIANGEYGEVVRVIEYNAAEGWSLDVTEDIARSVAEIWANEGEPLKDWQFGFVAQHISMQVANSFKRAA